MSETEAAEHFDVLVVGAGISGIDAGYRLQTECPGKSFCILEARDAIGGTWDLFRFPGIRSDSSMHTLGFPFRPWRGEKTIAGGEAIRTYIRETAELYGIDRRIRFGQRAIRASWSSTSARWTVETAGGRRFTAGFLHMCSGYYDYAAGYMPDFPGAERFTGRIVHPQLWPEDLDHAGKRVVVIGSGATAVTTIPALACTAAHVTMLQRSPSYIVSRSATDRLAERLRAWLPTRLADGIARWIDVLVGSAGYILARRRPAMVRKALMTAVSRDLGPDYDVGKDFSPPYNPWDQRVCLTPDGELFAAIREGRVSVATDTIDCFTETGIRLGSGGELPADIIVPATGLVVKLMGGMEVTVDGAKSNLADKLVYKGMMFNDVPNLTLAFGYINASWTLKCDLTARAVCRLLKHMDRQGYAFCMPRVGSSDIGREPMLNFTSGYVRRAEGVLPHQGTRAPWRVHQNYLLDMLVMRFGLVEDGVLEFAKGPRQ
ncbi:MAG TPA: NAD(P)/FAD-dependent oxidoreductase [Alphaproteobacteria bacterium]|nr:NAD(P)/FAD-dependent oxidoreductase [Alphaproteobacteria bacterium]